MSVLFVQTVSSHTNKKEMLAALVFLNSLNATSKQAAIACDAFANMTPVQATQNLSQKPM